MFLKKLWSFNKTATIIFLLFIAIWAFFNIKQSAVAAPCFQYGMYSGKFFTTDTLQVIKLYANNEAVDLSNYSMAQRDLLQSSLEDYTNQQPTNEKVFHNMKRVLSKIGIGNLMKEENYENNIRDEDFANWYKKLAEKILGYPIITLEAYQQKYLWKNDQLVPAGEPVKINFIAAN